MKILFDRFKTMTIDHIILAILLFGIIFTLIVMYFSSGTKEVVPQSTTTEESSEQIFKSHLPQRASAQ